jgi:transcriptional regulator with XRE-family HTH domain
MQLADHLKRKGKTPESFAEEAGVKKRSVYDWLAGNKLPRPERMRVIAALTDNEVTAIDWMETPRVKRPKGRPRMRRSPSEDRRPAA